jgi:hypothetical protein
MSPLLASEGVTDPAAWGQAFGSLGPIGLLLVPLGFALLVVIGMLVATTIALTGIRRLGMPGLAWTLGGVRLELHGLRLDLRAWQSGEPLEPLEPLDANRSLFPPKVRKEPTSEPPEPPAPAPAPTSRRAGRAPQRSRPQ